jgi:protein-disulfide isomerase
MRKANSSTRGSAVPIILLVVSLLGIGFAGWFYVSKLSPNKVSEEMVVEQALEEGQPPATEGTLPPTEMPPTDEIAPAETAPAPEASTGEAVTIDVAKATGVRAIGNADAPIKMIEYASLTCSHCAHFHNEILPALKSKYIDTGKVYLEFREFPLNDPALKATLTARCLPEDKYESFVSLLFKSQDQWAGGIDYMASLKQNAKLAGMSDATFEACQAEPMLKLKIAENMQEAKDKWKISSTPTFIINDGAETISGAQPIENFERVFRKITDGAVGEAPPVE